MTNADDRSIDGGGRSRQLATLALIGLILFAVSTIVSFLLKPDLHPATNFLSEHSLGEYGFVMTAGFAIFGISILLLTIALWADAKLTASGRIGAILLAIGGVAMVGVALFPAEVDPIELSLIGQLHVLSATVYFLAAGLGALLVALSFRHNGRWQPYAGSELGLAIATLIAVLLFFVAYPLQTGNDPSVPQLRSTIGIIQRVTIFMIWLWLVVTSARMRRIAAPASTGR